jgi:hypothetical protein
VPTAVRAVRCRAPQSERAPAGHSSVPPLRSRMACIAAQPPLEPLSPRISKENAGDGIVVACATSALPPLAAVG